MAIIRFCRAVGQLMRAVLRVLSSIKSGNDGLEHVTSGRSRSMTEFEARLADYCRNYAESVVCRIRQA